MSGQLAPIPFRAWDNNGNPLVGGLLNTYVAGTTTPQATYTDSTLGTPNTNPVVLNARGEANVWLNTGQLYKFILQDASGNTIWSQDQVQAINLATITQAVFQSYLPNVAWNGGPTDGSGDSLFHRTANYSGGTPGFVNTAFTGQTDVGLNATSYEWTILGIMNNSATAGQNVAGYFQGNRVLSGAGPTWAAVAEARELVATNNPAQGLVTLEVDNRSNGTDASNNRIGIHIVASRYNVSGADTTMGIGLAIDNNVDGTHTSIGTGVFIGNKFGGTCNVNIGFDCSQANIQIGALKMAAGVPILFDAGASNQLLYDGNGLLYRASSASVSRLNADGSISLGGSTLPIKLNGTTATTATAGGGQAVLATVLGYLVAVVNGTTVKIPYFSN